MPSVVPRRSKTNVVVAVTCGGGGGSGIITTTTSWFNSSLYSYSPLVVVPPPCRRNYNIISDIMNNVNTNNNNNNRRHYYQTIKNIYFSSSSSSSSSSTTTKQQQQQQQLQQPQTLATTAEEAAETAVATTTTPTTPKTTTQTTHYGIHFSRRMEFRVRAALEMKEEKQRLRLAQIVKDLNDNNVNVNNSGSKATTTSTNINNIQQQQQQETQDPPASSSSSDTFKREISLDGIDFQHIHELIIPKLLHGYRLDRPSLLQLLKIATKKLQSEPTLIDLRDNSFVSNYQNKVSSTVSIVGDLHGCITSLKQVLELLGFPYLDRPNDRIVVFDGDYVDRGKYGIEVLSVVLLLKLRFPKNVIVLRGNHEDRDVATAYGFRNEIHTKYMASLSDVWSYVKRLFAAMPLGVVTKKAFICHGGIPTENFQLSDLAIITSQQRCQMITSVSVPETDKNQVLMQGILWNDPCIEYGMHDNVKRGVGKLFGPDIANDFLERENLKYVVRAHEPMEDGYSKLYCNRENPNDIRKVFTVFSAAGYPDGKGENCKYSS